MLAKIKRVAIVTALSVAVFIATGVLTAWLGGFILGSTADATGQEKLKGGSATTLAVVTICAIVSIIFAIWLSRLLNKMSEVKSDD